MFDLVRQPGPEGGTRGAIGMQGSRSHDGVGRIRESTAMPRQSWNIIQIGQQASRLRLIYPWLATNGRFLGVALLSIFSAIEPYHHPG